MPNEGNLLLGPRGTAELDGGIACIGSNSLKGERWICRRERLGVRSRAGCFARLGEMPDDICWPAPIRPLLSLTVNFRWRRPMLAIRTAFLSAALLLGATTGFAQQSDTGRFLIYFDEFSANLTEQTRATIADVARRAREGKAVAVRIEARASATGSPLANRYLALTRSQVVADELVKDGLDAGMLQQVAIGQSGSEDPSVAERRVDIVIER